MTTALAMDRRVLLQRAMLLLGASVMPGGAEALAAAAKAGARLLDAKRYELLTAVADTIVPKTDTPGAVEAGVPQVIDSMLRNWASPARRAELTAALDAIDARARAAGHKSFASLTPQQRHDLLVPHDAAALKVVPRPAPPPPATVVQGTPTVIDPKQGRAKQETTQDLRAGPPVADPGYGKLKELIVIGYYYSEAALTHELPYEHAPGQWQPSIPVTPQTRPAGGAGLV